jgi:hypothetical protein
MTQLTFEGLTLEMSTLDIGPTPLGENQRSARRTCEVSLLFDEPCASADDTEDRLVAMLEEEPAGRGPDAGRELAREPREAM